MTSDPFSGLPGALRRLMEARELTQVELARRSAIPQPRISGYLRGEREPTLRNLARLLVALEATVADLATALGAETAALPPLSNLIAVVARQERRIAELEALLEEI